MVAPPLSGIATGAAGKFIPQRGSGILSAAWSVLQAVFGFPDDVVGKLVVIDPCAVEIFHGGVHAPRIALVLFCTLLGRGADDAELDRLRFTDGNPGEFVSACAKDFIQAGHPAIDLHPWAGTGIHRKAIPRVLKRPAALVAHR